MFSSYQFRNRYGKGEGESEAQEKTLYDAFFTVVQGKRNDEVEVSYFFDPSVSYKKPFDVLPEEVEDIYRPSNESMKSMVRDKLSNLYLKFELVGHVLTLDDSRASFSKHLNKVLHLPKKMIHVPNPFVSRSIVKENKCILYPHKVGSTVRNLHSSHKPFSLVFLDYICTWKGNVQTTPSKDIETIFRFMKLTQVSILAVTICTRTTKKKKKYLEDVDEAKRFIAECASRCRKGCRVDCVDVITYGVIATMIFVVYK
jgi:hypothetical protein